MTSPISFSCTVMEAADTEPIGKRIVHHKTPNISANGVLFETDLPLQKEDRVALEFHSTQTVNATGWVVRSKDNGTGVHSVAVKILLFKEEDQRLFIEHYE